MTSEITESAIKALLSQLTRDFRDYAPISSQHEGFALLKERLDQLWQFVQRREREEAMHEALLLAAVAMRFVIEAPITHQSQK